MTRTPWYLSLLFSLVLIAAPALVLFWFYLPGWGDNVYDPSKYWLLWVIGLAFIAYACGISALFIFFKIVNIDCLNIDLPMALSLAVILVASPLEDKWWWTKLLMMLGTMLTAIPVNMFTSRIIDRQIEAIRENNKKIRGRG